MVARLTFAAWLATGSVASAQEPCIPEEVRERVSCPAESDAAPEGASSGAVDEEVRQVMAALDQAASSAARDASGQVVRSRVHGGELDVTPRPLTPGEGGLVGRARELLCAHPDRADVASLRYRLARFFHDAHHYDEAALRFEVVAREHSDQEVGVFAAALWLDALNVIATRGETPRGECGVALEDAIAPLRELYCADPARGGAHEGFCDTLETMRCRVARARAERLAADGEHEGAAVEYLRQATECAPADELLYNAAIHFDRSHQAGRALATRRQLIAEHPAAPTAMRAAWQVARALYGMGRYEEAAAAHATFARRYPGEDGRGCIERDDCPNGPAALSTAITLTMATGSIDEVRELVTIFGRNYARRLPAELAHVEAKFARWLAERERNREARDVIERALQERGQALSVEARLELLVMQGRLGFGASARNSLTDAAALADATLQAMEGEPDRASGVRAWGAEARYQLAELARMDWSAASRRAAVNLAARLDALRAVEALYSRAASYESTPWIVASARRVGEMYLALADALPRGAEASRLRQVARERLEFCLVTGVRTRTLGEATRVCGERLSELDPETYPPPMELTGGSLHRPRE